MNGVLNFKEIRELFRSEKSIKVILIISAVFVLVIAFAGIGNDTGSDNKNTVFDYGKQAEYETALEEKLGKILSKIDGIGNIDIMITLDCSEENVFGTSKSDPVCVKTPAIRGVIVVCDGGNNILIKEKVISAVSGAFGISTTRVSVIK